MIDAMIGVRLGLLVAIVAALPAWACTGGGCTDGEHLRSRFLAKVTFEGKPLAGAEIVIQGDRGTFRATTDSNGQVAVGPIPEGVYSMSAQKIGYTTWECIRIVSGLLRGKREKTLRWGDKEPTVVAAMSGRWVRAVKEPIAGESPLERLKRRATVVPIEGKIVRLLRLQEPEQRITTDKDGLFRFDGQPAGLYVMILGDDDSGFMIRVDPKAKRESLSLTLSDSSCGPALFIQ